MKTLVFTKSALIVLCGPSGSGKSYFAQKYFKPSQVVSSDKCREIISDDESNQEVSADAFDLFYTIIGYRLKHSRLTVADATNLSAQYRRRLIQIAKRYGSDVYLVMFQADLEVCRKHNDQRERTVPENIIALQIEKFKKARENVHSEEYKEIYIIKSEEIGEVKIEVC